MPSSGTIRARPPIRPLVKPGAVLPNDSGSFDLDLLSAWAPTHADFVTDLERLQGELTFTFDAGGGPTSVTARELARDISV